MSLAFVFLLAKIIQNQMKFEARDKKGRRCIVNTATDFFIEVTKKFADFGFILMKGSFFGL